MKMKLIFYFLLFFSCCALNLKAQTITVLTEKPAEYTSVDAGRYAKLFGKKFMYDSPRYNNFQNYSFSIKSWDVIKYPKGQTGYRVFIKTSWDEMDGFFRYHFSYEGAVIFDQFGCQPMILVTAQEQPNFYHSGERTYKNNIEDQKWMQAICPNAQYHYAYEDCIDD